MKHQMTFLLRYLSSFKLRTQLIVIISIQIIIICSYVLALNLTHHTLLLTYFSQISNFIFEENSNDILSNTINAYSSYFDSIFYLNGNSLVSYHRLYQETKRQINGKSLETNPYFQMTYGGTTKIPEPIRITKGYGKNDVSYSFMCYSNVSTYNSPLTQDEKIGIKLQEQLQALGSIIYQGSLINQSFLYSYVIKEKINSIYPCLNRDIGIYSYIPENRDWYKELKKNYQKFNPYNQYNYSFTTPYLLYTDKKIGLSMTLPIVNENLQLIGGLASNFLGAQFVNQLKHNSFGLTIFYLISYSGIMIMHPYNVSVEQLPLYIYNQSITGFNESDWEQINQFNYQSSCLSFSNTNFQFFCRYNSIYRKDMIIKIQDIPEYKLKLIILLSSEEYTQFFDDYSEKLQNQLKTLTEINIFYLIGLFFFVCLIILLVTKLIFHPIDIIKKQALNSINLQKQQKIEQIPIIIDSIMSEDITQLYQSYQIVVNKLQLLSFHKTSQCKNFEELQYPKQYCKFSIFCQNQIENLELQWNFKNCNCKKCSQSGEQFSTISYQMVKQILQKTFNLKIQKVFPSQN